MITDPDHQNKFLVLNIFTHINALEFEIVDGVSLNSVKTFLSAIARSKKSNNNVYPPHLFGGFPPNM